jgi:hypothetical protein
MPSLEDITSSFGHVMPSSEDITSQNRQVYSLEGTESGAVTGAGGGGAPAACSA